MTLRNLVLAQALFVLTFPPAPANAQDSDSRNPYTTMHFTNPFVRAKGKNKSEGESLEALLKFKWVGIVTCVD